MNALCESVDTATGAPCRNPIGRGARCAAGHAHAVGSPLRPDAKVRFVADMGSGAPFDHEDLLAFTGQEWTERSERPRLSFVEKHLFEDRLATLEAEDRFYRADFEDLECQLLCRGGVAAEPPRRAKELASLILYPHPRLGLHVELWQAPGDPRANVAALYRDGHLAEVAWGWALCADGIWREHYWGILADGSVVETAERHDVYHGMDFARGPLADREISKWLEELTPVELAR